MTSAGWRIGVVLFVALAGCSSVGADPNQSCTYNGTARAPGSTFPANDGCNSCFCGMDGQVSCTLLDCIGDGGNSCFYGGQPYQVGDSFPSTDGCNSCGCSPTGAVTCTERACDDLCVFDTTYTFGSNGGFVAYVDTTTLAPPGVYTHTRTPARSGLVAPAVSSCAPALPACHTDGAIDVSDIVLDLRDEEVQKALAMMSPPVYGVDTRPNDGSISEVKRASGGSLLVGGDCPPASSSCRPIPPGVAKLVADLAALDAQQLKDPTCTGLHN